MSRKVAIISSLIVICAIAILLSAKGRPPGVPLMKSGVGTIIESPLRSSEREYF